MDFETLNKWFAVSSASPSGLIWILDNVDANNRVNNKAKDFAGNKQLNGYWKVSFKGRDFYVHRIIYLLMHKNIRDDLVIDHIDRNPSNNSIDNLRQVTRSDNLINSNARTKTGVKGVYFNTPKSICSSWHYNGVRGWSKAFSLDKYELSEAINLARQARDEGLAKLIERCKK